MKNKSLSLTLVGLALSGATYAQVDSYTALHNLTVNIPSVALVDIESASSTDITLGFTAPVEAGLGLTSSGANNSLWLNYSSIKASATDNRQISVKLNQFVDGVDITLLAGAASATGAGTKGTPSVLLTLTTSDQVIISDIGSTYTGNGVSNGHNLTYNMLTNTSDYASLVVSNPSVIVTYTISDD